MQQLIMSDKSLMVGDDIAELLMEYAALIAKVGSGDTVKVRAFGADGDEVMASFLLNSGTVLRSETSRSSLPEPENRDAEAYLRRRLASYTVGATDLIGLLPEDGDPAR
jgi:hypothetical protein